jgi:deoxyribonuclease V
MKHMKDMREVNLQNQNSMLIDHFSMQRYTDIQNALLKHVQLVNRFRDEDIQKIAGVDLAYWERDGKDYAACCIIIMDRHSHEVLENKYLVGEIFIPYMPGFLSFRELPLVINTYQTLLIKPDIILFDGNGILHYRRMGIATHASFCLNKPTIGVAKSYLKIADVNYDMPLNITGAYTDIIINGDVYGRVVRTRKNVKPIFVSCGNWIDIDTSTDIVLQFITGESRLPQPIRIADIETKKVRQINFHKGGETK